MYSWPSVLSQWSFDPPIVLGIVLAALLYWRGLRPLSDTHASRRTPTRIWNALAFYAGLGAIVIALESPIDRLSASLFTFHMMQHVLLIMVAGPLMLLGDPGINMVRGLPLAFRRSVLGFLSRQSWLHSVVNRLSWLRSPAPVLLLFLGDLYLWHWNRLFDLTLQNNTVHISEHFCFLATGLLFWSQIIDQRALHARLPYIQRAVYTLVAAAAGNFLAMYFVFAPKALYTAYAHPGRRLYGMTPLGDQQIAGAIMWIPVLFLFGGAFLILLYKALSEDEHQSQAVPIVGTPYAMPFTASDSAPSRLAAQVQK
jgi:putative membrane protein